MAGVSLITVRRALQELERAGPGRGGHQGVGTFVALSSDRHRPGRTAAACSAPSTSEAVPL